jgi:hypothetical protein
MAGSSIITKYPVSALAIVVASLVSFFKKPKIERIARAVPNVKKQSSGLF